MDVSEAIAKRVTTKMLGDPDNPLPVRHDMQAILRPLLAVAGWAPFHRPAHTSHRRDAAAAIVEPWRFYVLDAAHCRDLLAILGEGSEKIGKIANMLAAADALILATWLPDPGPVAGAGAFEPTEENMEHIAAAAAAVQNFLVAATAAGLLTYWSSGGVLRSARVFQQLRIPVEQILLGAVFVFPDKPAGEVEILSGKQRAARSTVDDWTQWLAIGSTATKTG